MLPRKIFKNLHTVVAILVLFQQFLGEFPSNFLPLKLSTSPNMMHFICTFSILRAYDVRLIVIKKVQNYGKLYSSKTCLKMVAWRDASPHLPWICPHR